MVTSGTSTLPSGKKKAPAPPPPGVESGHMRHPSDPIHPNNRHPEMSTGVTGVKVTGHVRSPSDPPPLPAKPVGLRGGNPPTGTLRILLMPDVRFTKKLIRR